MHHDAARIYRRAAGILGWVVAGCIVGPALGQGVLVHVGADDVVRLPRPVYVVVPHPRPRPQPQPESSYKIKQLSVQARLQDQVAQVQVSQSFVNTGSRQMEVCFVFPLPYDGAVDSLTLMVDGKEFPAELLDAEKARRLYEQIVRKNKDPALLEWVGHGMFKTSVFPVPPGAERTVTLHYAQVCRKTEGLTEFLFPLSTAKYTSDPVEKIDFRVSIESSADVKNVYSPSHDIQVKRPDDRHAVVTLTQKDTVPSGDFRLFYDVGREKVQTSVISYRPDRREDGYFLLLASPEIEARDKKPLAKTVLFVVDRSGSMQGKKMEQARAALKFVLNNLRDGDRFNIVSYSSDVDRYRPELQTYDKKSRRAALGYVEGLYAGGGTNIDGALKSAMAMLEDEDRPSFVIFLTDGLPTVGETNEAVIVEHARKRNDVRARLFAFGVGYDVNSRMLDKLVRENYGQSQYVRPDEDIEVAVSQLYRRIGAPVITDVKLEFEMPGRDLEDGPVINRIYPRGQYDLFAGDQLVAVGRYRAGGKGRVRLSGAVSGQREMIRFPARLEERSRDESHAFVEKLWAVRRIGDIIDQIDLHGKNDELVDELVRLAKRHGVLTPYTSFLADENNQLRDELANRRAATNRLRALEQSEGKAGFAQRTLKGSLQRAAQAPASAADSLQLGASLAPVAGREADKERKDAAINVQMVGAKTFYRRDGRWVDSALTAQQEKSVQKVERFSKEYFALIDKHGLKAAQYLAIEGPVTVVLDDQAYSF